jgi:hypothetical protein
MNRHFLYFGWFFLESAFVQKCENWPFREVNFFLEICHLGYKKQKYYAGLKIVDLS